MNLKNTLGGQTEIRNNANAFIVRTSSAPFISAEKQPVLYSILKKIADKEGMTVEGYQRKMDKELH